VDSDPELPFCPNERLDLDGVALVVDELVGMPPIEPLGGADALELELDDKPNADEETRLGGDNSADGFEPAGRWLAALSKESRPRPALEPLDPGN
jgi:hypothetical protein